MNLKEAKEKQNLDQFIREREARPPGDMTLFGKTFSSMIQCPDAPVPVPDKSKR